MTSGESGVPYKTELLIKTSCPEVSQMTKSKLAAMLAKRVGFSLKDAKAAVDALFSTNPKYGIIVDELRKRRRVQIAGFGTFETRQRKARDGRNPQTGEKIRISATRYPAFQAGTALKDRVRR